MYNASINTVLKKNWVNNNILEVEAATYYYNQTITTVFLNFFGN